MDRLAPMLAVTAEPFDSSEYLFEVKWDGVRALAAVEQDAWHVWGRHSANYTDRYPELSVLRQLPAGTILDGELIRLVDGRADFAAILRRHQLTSTRKIRWAVRQQPVTYVVFDLLRLGSRSLLEQPLRVRRGELAQLLSGRRVESLALSDGVVGSGRRYFEQAVDQGHEGMIAKRLDSHYCPGQRLPAWKKIKPREQTVGVIVGYRLARGPAVSRILVAARRDGSLHYAGEVRCGMSDHVRHELHARLRERHCDRPIIPCPAKRARWVRPELYCLLQFFGWTGGGRLRFPSFQQLLLL